MKTIISCCIILISACPLFGGTGIPDDGSPASLISLQMPLKVSDNLGSSNTLMYGLAADATDGLDQQLGEFPLPPFPPAGSFEARFILNQFDASYKDYRQGTTAFAGTKVHTIQYQTGGASVTVAWQLPGHVRGRLQDVILGTIVDAAMNGTGSFTVTNPLGINKLKITLTYLSGISPAPAPALLAPANNTSGVSVPVLFSWNMVNGCDAYRLQLSRDALFSVVVFDSLVSDTTRRVFFLPSAGQYFWRVRSVNAAGEGAYSSAFTFFAIAVAVEEEMALPSSFVLYQNYPNPFNPVTRIQYQVISQQSTVSSHKSSVDGQQSVSLKIYDVLGREVATLVNEEKVAGTYTVYFNASSLSSGTYFYELRAGEYSAVKKMIVLR